MNNPVIFKQSELVIQNNNLTNVLLISFTD